MSKQDKSIRDEQKAKINARNRERYRDDPEFREKRKTSLYR